LRALDGADHAVSVGFDKTWGQDVLYPQGGLHAASAVHNLYKYADPIRKGFARVGKWLDLAHWSFTVLERRQYLHAPRPLVIVNSEMVRRHFEHYYHFRPDELHIVRCAIDPARFISPERPRLRIEWRRKWGIAPRETVGLFVAMNYRLKGLEPLLHAVARLPHDVSFRLLVAGNPRIQSYQRLARRLGIAEQVTFLGPCPEIQRCYFAADFLVHPTFYDPCSLVALEALACGLPVITSRFNGASELLHPPQDGYVIQDPHDHAELANCIKQLLDPATRSACAQAARRTAAAWTFEHHYQKLLQVFAEAATRKRAA
jgi:UDP-glucose:(heptosyl)LPS alpha-1,3-glucosyltransferase